MRKTYSFFIVYFFIYSFSLYGQTPKNDLTKSKLFGKVQSLKDSTYNKEFEWETANYKKYFKPGIYVYRLFDISGTEIENYKKDEDFEFYTKLYFDSSGNLIEYYIGNDDSSSVKTLYSYNKNGKLFETKSFYTNGKLINRAEYIYNNNNILIEKTTFENDGGLSERTKYKYNLGKIKEENTYSANGDLKRNKLFNDKGVLIEDAEYNVNGILIHKKNYDDRGNCVYEMSNETDPKYYYKIIYKYDDKDNCIEELNYYTESGDVSLKKINKYDDKGNIIYYSIYRLEDRYPIETKAKVVYKFDSHGNWIERIEFSSDGEPLKINRRQIEYYN